MSKKYWQEAESCLLPPHRRTIEGASGIKRYCNPSVCLSHATMTKTVRFRHMVIY